MPLPYRLLYALRLRPWERREIPTPLRAVVEAGTRRGRALDLGCGTGDHALYLSSAGFEVVALDFMPRAITQARERPGADSVTWMCADVRHLDAAHVGDGFSLVLDSGCLFSLPGGDVAQIGATLAGLSTRDAKLLRFGLLDGDTVATSMGDAWQLMTFSPERQRRAGRHLQPAWALFGRAGSVGAEPVCEEPDRDSESAVVRPG